MGVDEMFDVKKIEKRKKIIACLCLCGIQESVEVGERGRL